MASTANRCVLTFFHTFIQLSIHFSPFFHVRKKRGTDRRTDRPTDGRTDRPTDGRTDKAGCRVTCTRLKKIGKLIFVRTGGRMGKLRCRVACPRLKIKMVRALKLVPPSLVSGTRRNSKLLLCEAPKWSDQVAESDRVAGSV